MQQEESYIATRKSESLAFNACCGWSDVSRLYPGEWFGNDLIDTLPSLLGLRSQSKYSVLSSHFLGHIRRQRHAKSCTYSCNLSRLNHFWLIPVCNEEFHWYLIEINWKDKVIGYYDSTRKQNELLNTPGDQLDIPSGCVDVAQYIHDLYGEDMEIATLHGPQQTDKHSCGPIVVWEIQALVNGGDLSDRGDVDWDSFRTNDCLESLLNALRSKRASEAHDLLTPAAFASSPLDNLGTSIPAEDSHFTALQYYSPLSVSRLEVENRRDHCYESLDSPISRGPCTSVFDEEWCRMIVYIGAE
jgi:Ulp1 protease family, C-terminal catalytic domain